MDETEIKPLVRHVLNFKDIKTPEELLDCFKLMDTTFFIVDGSDTHHAFLASDYKHLLIPED